LAELRESKKSLEQRGISTVTTSGVLVTLLLGVAALITSRAGYTLPPVAKPWLYSSMGSFVLAALGGLLTNIPVGYESPTVPALYNLAKDRWRDAATTAERTVYTTRLKVIASYKTSNKWKARILSTAIGLEVVAILLLAVTVGLIVNHG
jgi:hypothetical protein